MKSDPSKVKFLVPSRRRRAGEGSSWKDRGFGMGSFVPIPPTSLRKNKSIKNSILKVKSNRKAFPSTHFLHTNAFLKKSGKENET